MQIRFSNDAAHIRSHRLHVQKILPLWHSAVTLFSFGERGGLVVNASDSGSRGGGVRDPLGSNRVVS